MSLSLLEPVFVFTGLKWDFYIKSIPASLPFLPDSMREKMLADIGGTDEIDMNDPLARMIAEATEHYAVALPLPKAIEAKQLLGLDMPVYVALGGKSVLHDSQKAYDIASQNIKELKIKIWKDGTIKIVSEETHNKAKRNLKYALGFAAGSVLLFVALVVFTLI